MNKPAAPVSDAAREAALGLFTHLYQEECSNEYFQRNYNRIKSGGKDRSIFVQAFAQFEATIRADQKEREWLDIAEAPKDGTIILALEIHPNPRFRSIVYEGRYVIASQLSSLLAGTERLRFHNLSANKWSEPTHWMPHPAIRKGTDNG